MRRGFGVRARQPGQGGAALAHTGALGLKSAHLARAVHGYSERRRIVQRGDEKALGISSSLSPGLMSSQNSPRRRSACQRAVGAQLDTVPTEGRMPPVWAPSAGALPGVGGPTRRQGIRTGAKCGNFSTVVQGKKKKDPRRRRGDAPEEDLDNLARGLRCIFQRAPEKNRPKSVAPRSGACLFEQYMTYERVARSIGVGSRHA